jgi:hypothetical protein
MKIVADNFIQKFFQFRQIYFFNNLLKYFRTKNQNIALINRNGSMKNRKVKRNPLSSQELPLTTHTFNVGIILLQKKLSKPIHKNNHT